MHLMDATLLGPDPSFLQGELGRVLTYQCKGACQVWAAAAQAWQEAQETHHPAQALTLQGGGEQVDPSHSWGCFGCSGRKDPLGPMRGPGPPSP